MRRAWITRASPGAVVTAGRVRALGWEPLIAPVLKTQILPASIDLAGVGALAFTSANGVRAFSAQVGERDLTVFAVGAATAQTARDAGFKAVLSAEGDVTALGTFIIARAGVLEGAVLHAGAAELAGDLVAQLQGAGVLAQVAAVYETVIAQAPADIIARLDSIQAVLVHSPRAGRRLGEILSGHAAPKMCAYCLSGEVLATLDGLVLGAKVAAPMPNEDALLSLLADHRKTPRKAT